MTQQSAPAVEAAPPPPTFDAIPLGPEVRKAVDALGYTHPTPVQLAVYEPATRGRSLVVQARTGTGKTAAFGLPIVDTLVRKSEPHVQALILTPTRELALQVAAELGEIAKFRGTKILAVYGGAPMGRQIAALEDGAQVVAGTPGRVLDHIRRGTLDTKHIRIFVLDEADEMLSMGFAKELNAIIETLPRDRQGLYFSATIPPDVDRLAKNHLKDPEYVTLSSDQVGALEIAHFVYLVREGDKRGALTRIIEVEDPESAIVFCNTKDETERVSEALTNKGYDAAWLNGDLEQKERERIMAKTREGKLRFLVATDVAARGIDISHLTHVINADFPESAEQYVHRTGRTGRAGKTGTAISLVGPKDVGHLYMLRLTYKIRPVERMLPSAGELRTRSETDLVGFLAEAYAGKVPDALHVAVARRLLTHESSESIIAGLLADHLGARRGDPAQEAADARRAKNPPPTNEKAAFETKEPVTRSYEAPATLRGAENRERKERPPQRDAGPRPAGRRRSADLAGWEPPPERDDDAPLLAQEESGTRPGLGGATGREKVDRGRRERHRDNAPAMPGVTIEDAPTIAEGQASRPDTAKEKAHDESEEGEEEEPNTLPENEIMTIFVNVGRRDGIAPPDIHRLLTEGAGVGAGDMGRIRMRDRITFVDVRKERADAAIQALIGKTIGDRTVNAEVARKPASEGSGRPRGGRESRRH